MEATEVSLEIHPELARLSRLMYPRGRLHLLAMIDAFDAFMDESHNGVYCVGGFLGQPGGWNRLWGRWAKMIEDAGVSVLHMADCEGGHGEFEEMSREDRHALQRKAIGIIKASDVAIAGVVAGVEVEPYARLRPQIETYRRFLPGQPGSGSIGDPYFLAFQQAVESMSSVRIIGVPPSERIGFTFDQNHALQGRANHLYALLKQSPNLPYAKRMGQLAFDDKQHMVPLQAADFLVYETYRYLQDVRLGGKPERWQWKELRPAVKVLRLFQEPELLALLEYIRRLAEERSRAQSSPLTSPDDDV